jgi:hypothetical protein
MMIEQYDDKYINFCQPIKNNVINDGSFIRIFYSNEIVSFNGIYLLITLNNIICDKYYNKYKYFFNAHFTFHKEIIDKIKTIEENILKKIEIKNKVVQYKIFEQFENGNIRLFNEIENNSSCSFILKISGIWENPVYYGLTYKFIKVTNC